MHTVHLVQCAGVVPRLCHPGLAGSKQSSGNAAWRTGHPLAVDTPVAAGQCLDGFAAEDSHAVGKPAALGL